MNADGVFVFILYQHGGMNYKNSKWKYNELDF